MTIKGTPHFPTLQHYWSLNFSLFSVILGHLLGKSYLSAVMQSVYCAAVADWDVCFFRCILYLLLLNKFWRQHPIRQQLYGHQPPITKTIKIRRTRHAGHCWTSRDELIRDVLLWTPSHGRAKAGRRARTDIQQLCVDTGCSPEDLPKAMDDSEVWRKRVRNIRADSRTWWWWWWWYFLIYLSLIEVCNFVDSFNIQTFYRTGCI